MRNRPLRDIFGACDSAEPASHAETIDEYRELAMLARAWERDPPRPGVTEEAPGRADDTQGKEPVPR